MRLIKDTQNSILKVAFDEPPTPGFDVVTGACYVVRTGKFHYYVKVEKIAYVDFV